MGGKPSKGTKRDHRLKENKTKTVKAPKPAFKGAAKPFGK
jgi:hypothetical protein